MTQTNYGSAQKQSSLLRIGGGLAIAGCIIGVFIFCFVCFGYGAAFPLSFLPVAFGAVALVLTVIGGSNRFVEQTENTHVLASVFVSLFSILGGLVLMAAWKGWEVFFK